MFKVLLLVIGSTLEWFSSLCISLALYQAHSDGLKEKRKEGAKAQ